MSKATTICGRKTSDEPRPMTMQGMTGWWSLPGTWFAKPIKDSPNLLASPNSDFSPPTYVCTLGDDQQTFVFQDIYRDKLTGTLP